MCIKKRVARKAQLVTSRQNHTDSHGIAQCFLLELFEIHMRIQLVFIIIAHEQKEAQNLLEHKDYLLLYMISINIFEMRRRL